VVQVNDQAEKLRKAFEHENRIRNKVVKAVSGITGVSEKYLVQESHFNIEKRLHAWVKDLKRSLKKGLPELEDEIERLRALVEEKDGEVQKWIKRSQRIKSASERLCADVERRVREIRGIENEEDPEHEDLYDELASVLDNEDLSEKLADEVESVLDGTLEEMKAMMKKLKRKGVV
jgi:hypothetical protein